MMPHLRGGLGDADVVAAVDDQSAADAGSEREHDHHLRAAARSEGVFAQRGHVRVIAHKRGHADLLGNRGQKLHVVPVLEVRRPDDDAFLAAVRSRHAHAHARDIADPDRRVRHGHSDRLHDLDDSRFQALHGLGIGPAFADDLAGPIHHRRADVGSAQIGAYDVVGILVELH